MPSHYITCRQAFPVRSSTLHERLEKATSAACYLSGVTRLGNQSVSNLKVRMLYQLSTQLPRLL